MLLALTLSACGPNQGATSASSSPAASTGSTPDSLDDQGYHSGQTDYQVSDPVTQLRLDAHAGRVTVSAGDGPVKVTESYRYSDDKPATSHQVTGDTLQLREDGCAHVRMINGRCEVDWDITAPAGTNLTLDTDSGGIAVTAMTGTVDAQTHSGGVRGRTLASKTVTARTDSGGVDLRFVQPPDQVDAISEAGGIQIRVPGATSYAVDAHTEAGGLEIDVPRADGSPHKITARTEAGGIEISTG